VSVLIRVLKATALKMPFVTLTATESSASYPRAKHPPCSHQEQIPAAFSATTFSGCAGSLAKLKRVLDRHDELREVALKDMDGAKQYQQELARQLEAKETPEAMNEGDLQ
jgi:hypothetical protein